MSYDEPGYGQVITDSIDDLYDPLQDISKKLDVITELLEELVENERVDYE